MATKSLGQRVNGRAKPAPESPLASKQISIGKPIAECSYIIEATATEASNEGDLLSSTALGIVDGVINGLNESETFVEDVNTVVSMLYAARYLLEMSSALRTASYKLEREALA
jgi:hypothetical protein